MAVKKLENEAISGNNTIIIQEPSKKVVVKSVSEVDQVRRIQTLTSKAMGFPKMRRMGDGSPIPHTITYKKIKENIPILDGYGEAILDGYGEPITRVETRLEERKVYKINPYMQHYDIIHKDGYGERVATSVPPTGVIKNDRNERIVNKYLTADEQDELESLCVGEQEIPKDWDKKPVDGAVLPVEIDDNSPKAGGKE